MPSYDSLSLPSLRARLRNLDIDQVRMLAEYERGHAARADVITMFERRIDKLAASDRRRPASGPTPPVPATGTAAAADPEADRAGTRRCR